MKKLLSLIMLIYVIPAGAQTAEEFMERGIERFKEKKYKAAIKEYDLAIEADNNLRDAYFNRGTCKIALEEYDAAISDFDKSVKIDRRFLKGYYSKALLLADQKKYKEALPELDRVIELDSVFANAITLRGQMKAFEGDKKGACEDFNRGKILGDSSAQNYILVHCGNEIKSGESLLLNWPENENWKIANVIDNNDAAMIELIHANEKLDNWTEYGYMSSMKGVINILPDQIMFLKFEQSQEKDPEATLSFIDKDDSAEYPWIFFAIETPGLKTGKGPEAQLWYIVQGKTSLYSNYRAVKKEKLGGKLQSKWIRFFQSSEIVYR